MHRMTSITLLTVCLEIKVKREPLPFPPVWCNLLLLFMQSSMCSCRQVSYLLIERMNSVIYKYVLQSIRLGSPEAKASWQHLQHIAAPDTSFEPALFVQTFAGYQVNGLCLLCWPSRNMLLHNFCGQNFVYALQFSDGNASNFSFLQ